MFDVFPRICLVGLSHGPDFLRLDLHRGAWIHVRICHVLNLSRSCSRSLRVRLLHCTLRTLFDSHLAPVTAIWNTATIEYHSTIPNRTRHFPAINGQETFAQQKENSRDEMMNHNFEPMLLLSQNGHGYDDKMGERYDAQTKDPCQLKSHKLETAHGAQLHLAPFRPALQCHLTRTGRLSLVSNLDSLLRLRFNRFDELPLELSKSSPSDAT